MSKAENKKLPSKSNDVPQGTQIKDLSVEKRLELFNVTFEKFQDEMKEVYGLQLGANIIWASIGAVPRIVIIDLLEKKNERQEKAVK